MGVDAELYIWGEPILEETLREREAQALQRITLSRYESRLIRPCEWWDDELSLYEVSLDGSRHFDLGNTSGFSGWTTVLRRLRILQPLFPKHFFIYTNDSYPFEKLGDGKLLTEERIQEIEADWQARAPEIFRKRES